MADADQDGELDPSEWAIAIHLVRQGNTYIYGPILQYMWKASALHALSTCPYVKVYSRSTRGKPENVIRKRQSKQRKPITDVVQLYCTIIVYFYCCYVKPDYTVYPVPLIGVYPVLHRLLSVASIVSPVADQNIVGLITSC